MAGLFKGQKNRSYTDSVLKKVNPRTQQDSSRKHKQSQTDLILAPSEYVNSGLPVTCDDKSKPSVGAEFGAFLGTDEGVKLLRQAIRSLMVKAAHGDTKAIQLLFNTNPQVTHINVEGLVGHLHKEVNDRPLSPAEQRKLELANKSAIIEGELVDE